MDDHGVSFLGYALIACGALLVGASHGLLAVTLRRRRGGARDDDGGGKETVAAPDEVAIALTRSRAREHCALNIFAGLLLSAGHVIAYRVVLIEHLCGCIVRRKGPVAVVTTALVALACAQLVSSHLVMLGRGAFPEDPKRHLRATAGSLSIIVLVIVAKFSLGIVHYDDPYCSRG